MKNIFEKIIDGELPADKVYETDKILAFLDLFPNKKGHTLVIPKTPVKDIFELPDDYAKELMTSIVKISKAVQKATNAKGINVTSNNGKEAGQVIFHLHFHIIPRYDVKEFSIPSKIPTKEERTGYKDDKEREEYAEKIRQSFE